MKKIKKIQGAPAGSSSLEPLRMRERRDSHGQKPSTRGDPGSRIFFIFLIFFEKNQKINKIFLIFLIFFEKAKKRKKSTKSIKKILIFLIFFEKAKKRKKSKK